MRVLDEDMDMVPAGREQGPIKRLALPGEVIEHLQILIRGISLHAIEGDPDDLKLLRERMAGIADSLNEGSTPDDLLVGIGKTLRALEDYNRRSSVIFKGQTEELREMLRTMTETVMFITSASETSVKQLSVLESKLLRTTTVEDIRQVKSYLGECLAMVRSESLRLQTESRSKINSLKSDVERLSSRLRAASAEDSQDPVTGLPGRFAAEEAIMAKATAGKDFVVALYMLDRLASINGRFGRQVGDEILVNSARMLAQRLSGTTLYRWTGPAFVAVFDPSVNVATAETRAKQGGSMRLEKNIETDDRSVLIVVTANCHLERVSSKVSPDTVFKNMDEFMTAHGANAAQA